MTADGSPEEIDVYDECGVWLGTKDRLRAHADGDWHRVFHCWVVSGRGGSGTVVLQRRASTKRTFPNLLDASATGHLASGEEPADGLRELREELGIDVPPASLVALGVRRIVDRTPEGLNRELAHVFLLRDDRPLAAYRPRPDEVSGLVDLPLAPGVDLVAGGRDEARAEELVTGSEQPSAITVRREDLVPALDGYWVVALVMAQRLLEGRRPLAI